jgi:ABC-type multidrug transport system fused ATPase/permease subunit
MYTAMAFYFATAFEDLAADTESDDFMDSIRSLAYTFLLLGVIAFVFMTLQSTLMETAAGHMTRAMQSAWFEALLRQDMAYYDVHDVAGQAIILSTNGSKYKSECLVSSVLRSELVRFTCVVSCIRVVVPPLVTLRSYVSYRGCRPQVGRGGSVLCDFLWSNGVLILCLVERQFGSLGGCSLDDTLRALSHQDEYVTDCQSKCYLRQSGVDCFYRRILYSNRLGAERGRESN